MNPLATIFRSITLAEIIRRDLDEIATTTDSPPAAIVDAADSADQLLDALHRSLHP